MLNPTTVGTPQDTSERALASESVGRPKRALVMGMGIKMFGKERRMLRSLSRMPRIEPLFLLSSWDLGEVTEKLDELGMPYRKATFGYLGFGHPWWTLKNLFYMPVLNWKVLKAHRDHRAEVLVFAEVLSFLNAFPAFLWLALIHRPRFVFYLGDIGGATRTQRLVARLADRFADCVIVNSNAVRDGLRTRGWKRSSIQVIYNGVDHANYRDVNPVDVGEFSDWPDDRFVFGFIGQLKANKGIEDFLLAAESIILSVPHARFLVIGDCPHHSAFPDELKQRFAGLGARICWLGFVTNVERYYAAMNAVVVASRHADPAPNVNLEAMAMGLPVIATATGGTPELIDDDVTGFLVPPRRPDEIARRMIQLASDADLANSMGASGKRRSQDMFDLSSNARTVESYVIGESDG